MDGMYAAGEIRLNISDIQHYSTGDGDGIRTTVFFKGCNLRCPWCHNPETLSSLPQRLREGNRERLCGRWMAVEEVLEEILWDVDFYRESGGGATLSGGEVLLQAAGAAELCRRLRERGISVVIDTAGDVPYSAFAPLNRLGVEYFYDWKACPAEYERVIGGNPVRIYENLARLIADGRALNSCHSTGSAARSMPRSGWNIHIKTCCRPRARKSRQQWRRMPSILPSRLAVDGFQHIIQRRDEIQ